MMLVCRHFVVAAYLAVGFALLAPAAGAEEKEPAAEQYRLALGLLLNQRVSLPKEAEAEFRAFLETYPKDERAPLARYWLGECLVRQERFADARAQYRIVAGKHGDCERHAEALFRLGEMSQRLGEPDEAVDAYARFQKRYGEHELADKARQKETAARVTRLRARLETKPEEAIALARAESSRGDAAGEEALFILGMLLFNDGDPEGAAGAYEDLLKRFPKSQSAEEAHFNAANAYIRLEKDAQALKHLDQVKAYKPDRTLYLRGAILSRQGKKKEAMQAFGLVVKKHRQSEYRLHSLFELGRLGDGKAWQTLIKEAPQSDLSDDARLLQATGLLEAGQPAKALETLRPIGAQSPRRSEADSLAANSHYRLGLAHEKVKKFKPAAEAYETILASYPKDAVAPYAMLRLGALRIEGERGKARALLQRLLQEHPGFEDRAQAESLIVFARNEEAWDLYEAKRYAEAAPVFSALRENAEYGADAAYMAGLAYWKAGDAEKAEAALTQFLKKHPKNQYALDAGWTLGEALAQRGKWQAAADHYLQLAQRLEKDKARQAEALLKAGMALYQLNHLPRAKQTLTRAIENGAPYVKARATFILGEIAFNQKQYEVAKQYFLKVTVLYEHEDLTPAAMLETAKCMQHLDEEKKAERLLQAILKDFGKSAYAATARQLLQKK